MQMHHSLRLRPAIAGVAAIAGPAGAAPKPPNFRGTAARADGDDRQPPKRGGGGAGGIAGQPEWRLRGGRRSLWYLSDFRGSRYDNPHNEPNLVNNRFISSGLGQLSQVGNNAETVFNDDGVATLVVCTGPNYTGSCGTVAPFAGGTLTATYINNVESIYWADSAN